MIPHFLECACSLSRRQFADRFRVLSSAGPFRKLPLTVACSSGLEPFPVSAAAKPGSACCAEANLAHGSRAEDAQQSRAEQRQVCRSAGTTVVVSALEVLPPPQVKSGEGAQHSPEKKQPSRWASWEVDTDRHGCDSHVPEFVDSPRSCDLHMFTTHTSVYMRNRP